MKKYLALGFTLVLGFMILSCENDDDRATVSPTAAATLSSNKTAVVLVKEDSNKDAISFTFSNPVDAVPVSYNNQLEVAVKGTNFAKSKLIDLPKDVKTVTYKTGEFNGNLLGLGTPTGVATDLEVRVKSTYFSLDGSAVNLPAPTYSAVIPLKVTLYTLASSLYVVGAFQGFNIGTAQEIISPTSNGIYEGTINFTAANSGFLIVPVRGSYDNKYGSNDNFNLIKGGGADLFNVNVGPQKITVNTNNLTYTLTP